MKKTEVYQQSWESERDRKQAECGHHFFITKCSLCNLILSSEHTHESTVATEVSIVDN